MLAIKKSRDAAAAFHEESLKQASNYQSLTGRETLFIPSPINKRVAKGVMDKVLYMLQDRPYIFEDSYCFSTWG